MNRSGRGVAFFFVLAVTAMWALSPVAVGQGVPRATGTMIIDVEGPRPLDDAIAELITRHGWAISYEELPLQYGGDTVDVTLRVRKDGDLTKPVIGAKGGRLRFAYDALPNGENAEAVLLDLLREYRASDPPIDFRLARTGDVFHVIPRTSRNARGVQEECTPLLDTTISIPEKERTVDEMLKEILAAVRAKVGGRLDPPGWASNLFMQTRVVGGADNESARSVLLRTLQATRRQVVWALLCSPTGTYVPGCTLNCRVVNPPSAIR
jgi:hypothetical protein